MLKTLKKSARSFREELAVYREVLTIRAATSSTPDGALADGQVTVARRRGDDSEPRGPAGDGGSGAERPASSRGTREGPQHRGGEAP